MNTMVLRRTVLAVALGGLSAACTVQSAPEDQARAANGASGEAHSTTIPAHATIGIDEAHVRADLALLPSATAECTPRPSAEPKARPSGFHDLEFTGQEWAFGSRYLHTAIWDGREMLVYGGAAGGSPEAAAFDPATDRWSQVAPSGLLPRVRHVGLWTGHAMVIFGGETPDVLRGETTTPTAFADGAVYDPCHDAWSTITTAPFSWRRGSSAVWSTTTGELLVFGGLVGDAPTADGWAYSLATRAWRRLAVAPLAARSRHAAVWTGRAMTVFGGYLADGSDPHDAASYDPATDSWSTVAVPADAPRGEVGLSTGATLSDATFWGGRTSATTGDTGLFATSGATLDPQTGAWSSIPAPTAAILTERTNAMVWWANGQLYVFGGHVAHDATDPRVHTAQDGAVYDAATRTWTHLARPLAYVMREGATVVWTGHEAILLGGAADCVTCNPLPTGGVVFTP